jgi:probable F420-dependent oxidoreductase
LVAVAQQAEKLGFKGIILAEHIYYPKQVESPYLYSEDGSSIQHAEMEFPDPLIAFGAIAAATQKLALMTGIYVLPLRHPIEISRNAATLAVLSGNRFKLGIGSGWLKEEFDQFGIDFHQRGKRMDEMMAIMRRLWSGEAVEHQGAFFNLDEIQIRPVPSQTIPIIGGGLSGKALTRSATRCEGWYGPGNSLDELPAVIEQLKTQRQAAGLSWSGYEIIAPLSEPLTETAVAKLEQLGVTGTVNYPFLFGIGPEASLEQKLRYMEDFAQRFIR